MGSFKSVKLNYDFASRQTTSTLAADVQDKEVELKYKSTTDALGFAVKGNAWSFDYDFGTKGLAFSHKRGTRFGELKVTQRVPEHKFELIPTPELELTTVLRDTKDMKHELVMAYDFQERAGYVEDTLELWDKYKLSVLSNTREEGVYTKLKSKVGKRYMKNVGMTYNKSLGPTLFYEAEPADSAELEAKYNLRSKTVNASLTLKPTIAPKVELCVDAVLSVGTPGKYQAGVVAGLKYKF